MRKNASRGVALVQVLALAMIALVLCASMIGSRMQPALVAAGAMDRVRDDLLEQAALNRLTEVWARNGSCMSDLNMGVSCGSSGGCSCTCTVDNGVTVASTAGAGGACSLSAYR